MRADRLLALLLLLQTRGRTAARELAERLEVSERTIYRDLDALSAAGVPVYAERGAHGGCVLRPGYRTDLTGLNTSDVSALFAGTTARVLRGLGWDTIPAHALAKIEAALPAERQLDAQRVRARVHVDAEGWFTAGEPVPHLKALRDAVFGDRIIELTYRGGDARERVRRVAPLGLVVKGGIWYLVAAVGEATRIFRVSRVHALRPTEEPFRRPARFDLAGVWARCAREFVARIPQYRARVRVQKPGLKILPQVLGERVRPHLARSKANRDGTVTVTLTFDSLDAACGQLLSLGTLVEALAPAELRAAIRRQAHAVSKVYGES